MKFAISALILFCSASSLAQKLDVKVIDRQDNETDYTYVVPSHFSAQSNSNANCFGSDSYVNCTGTTNTNGYATPAHQVSYHVRGATFTLLLPDGRGVIVNCESKFAERMAAFHLWRTFKLNFMVTRRSWSGSSAWMARKCRRRLIRYWQSWISLRAARINGDSSVHSAFEVP